MAELAISLLVIAVFCAFAEWRLGLLLCLATAILQDPLRKLIPGQPVYFVAFVAVVFGAACVGAWARGVRLAPRSIFGQYRQLAMPFSILMSLVIVQAFNSYLRFGNPMIPLIGLLTYVLPFPSIVFAYQLVFRQGEACINQFMKWYIVCIILALTTVYLEFSGYDWPVLGQVGEKLLIYELGAILVFKFRDIPWIGDRSLACDDGGMFRRANNILAKDQLRAFVDCCDGCGPSDRTWDSHWSPEIGY